MSIHKCCVVHAHNRRICCPVAIINTPTRISTPTRINTPIIIKTRIKTEHKQPR